MAGVIIGSKKVMVMSNIIGASQYLKRQVCESDEQQKMRPRPTVSDDLVVSALRETLWQLVERSCGRVMSFHLEI